MKWGIQRKNILSHHILEENINILFLKKTLKWTHQYWEKRTVKISKQNINNEIWVLLLTIKIISSNSCYYIGFIFFLIKFIQLPRKTLLCICLNSLCLLVAGFSCKLSFNVFRKNKRKCWFEEHIIIQRMYFQWVLGDYRLNLWIFLCYPIYI